MLVFATCVGDKREVFVGIITVLSLVIFFLFQGRMSLVWQKLDPARLEPLLCRSCRNCCRIRNACSPLFLLQQGIARIWCYEDILYSRLFMMQITVGSSDLLIFKSAQPSKDTCHGCKAMILRKRHIVIDQSTAHCQVNPLLATLVDCDCVSRFYYTARQAYIFL